MMTSQAAPSEGSFSVGRPLRVRKEENKERFGCSNAKEAPNSRKLPAVFLMETSTTDVIKKPHIPITANMTPSTRASLGGCDRIDVRIDVRRV
jgi:hypothetical protein